MSLSLIERVISYEQAAGPEWTNSAHHFKHGVWRFRKAFLKGHFQAAVHATTKIMQNPVIETFKEKLFAERESLVY